MTITPRAEASLEKIVGYLIDNASVETAERVRQTLLAAIYGLARMPSANPVAKGIKSKRNIVYRRVLSMSYRIIYTIEEDELQVLVVEIHHTKRDPKAISEPFE